MESAIPAHLRKTGICPVSTPAGHQPPFPAWTARFSPLTGQSVMACFGIQGPAEMPPAVRADITGFLSAPDGPGHQDLAVCTDSTGVSNTMIIAYWPCLSQFRQWQATSGFQAWWQAAEREHGDYGYFLEVVSPQAEHVETLFSDNSTPEGLARLGVGMSDEIIEHGYWGSARDRLPVAQHSRLTEDKTGGKAYISGKRVLLAGRNNLCLIRSGQDWSATGHEEREKYLTGIEPVLREGMHFLRDDGLTIGCLTCRYMQILDPSTLTPKEQTFGLAHFTGLAALELWAKSHPAHVAIFQGFMQYVQALNFKVALRLWHEIIVVPASAQHFEYINCHPETGLLRQPDRRTL